MKSLALLVLIAGLMVSDLVLAACSSTSYIDVTSLSLCVWDSNGDGVPDSGGTTCGTGMISVWGKAYTGVSLQAQCLSTSLFPAISPPPPTTTVTTSSTSMYVVTCNIPWSATKSDSITCPAANQVSINLLTYTFWGGFYDLVQQIKLDPNTVFEFGAYSLSLFFLGFLVALIARFLRRF